MKLHTSLLILFLAVSLCDQGNASDLYIKASYGESSALDQELSDDLIINNSEDIEGSAAYAIAAGYQFSPYLAAEISHASLSNFDFNESYKGWYGYDPYRSYNITHNDTLKITSRSTGLSTIFSTNIENQFFAGVKIGLQQFQTKWQETQTRAGYYFDIDPNSGDRYPTKDIATELDSYQRQKSGFGVHYGAIFGLKVHSWHMGLEHTIQGLENTEANMSAVFITKNF
ncbi:hypothetical protein AWR36_010355 [Microbulbifer flavimaris]|uniref:Outer membrane protein beta-barrel domain-containing protein n=1 Tax=Microbulbifer flavimaris TaxID=1781068 RepID=A0ABX4HYC2_9GAMM|nr:MULTISPECIES: hypothetical protein [Microbulbifer]KUJ82938.1 hypothetical protein AVO43_10325 [Microbulbifer sp. ZGT114]PCO05122.1 hypothetical protein AWR36_010355 [Microbulbifer flavimaris]